MATSPNSPTGIMNLPENDEMAPIGPSLSRDETYGAVTEGLRNASPQAADMYQQAMASAIPPELMQMSLEDLNSLVEMIEYLQENPQEYKQRVAEMVADGTLDQGDLPEEYDSELLAATQAMLMEALKLKQGGMQMPVQGFALGGIADAARIMANQGRNGDTMLAHITPGEAQLLRSRGGAGSINPVTGLPEFFIGKVFKAIGKGLKSVVKGVVGAVKKVLASPIGRMVVTIGLTLIGVPPVLANMAVTGLSGGSLKDIVIAGATSYFAAPGGTVSDMVGSANITNAAANAAITAGITGTGAALLSGQSLKNSVKSGLTAGLTAGAISAADTLSAGRNPMDVQIDNPNRIGGKFYEADPNAVPGTGPGTARATAPIVDSNQQIAPAAGAAAPSADPLGQFINSRAAAAGTTPARAPIFDSNQQIAPAAGTTPSADPLGQFINSMDAAAGTTPARAPIFDSNQQFDLQSSLNTDLPGTGIPAPGSNTGFFENAYERAKGFYSKNLSPSGIEAAGQDAAFKAGNAAVAKLDPRFAGTPMEATVFQNAFDAAKPGIIAQYGPLTAVGIGAMGAMGGFSPGKIPESELKETLSGTPGMDLIAQDPRRYLPQGIPGVRYTPEGAIDYSPAGIATLSPSYKNLYGPRGYADGGDVRTDFTKAEQDAIFDEVNRRAAASGRTPEAVLYEYATSQGYGNDQIDQAMGTYLKPGDTQAYINAQNNSKSTGLDTLTNKLTLDDVDIDQVYRDALAYAKSGAGTVEDYIRGAGLRNNVEQSAIDSVVSKAPTYTSTPDSYTSTPDPRYLENRYNPADLVYLGGPGGLQQPTNNFSANEQAVRDMYGTIGRKGVGTGAYQIDQAGLNHFTKQLDLGLIAPDQLSTVFGQSVTDYIAANPDDKYSQYVSNYQNKPTGPGSMRPTDPPPLLQPRQVETPDYVGNMKPKLLANGGMTSGGIANLAQGGYPRRNGQIDGLGTGTSDSIPAMLSDGEFVMTAKAVQGAGGGSRRDGAKKMYALMHQLERNAARG